MRINLGRDELRVTIYDLLTETSEYTEFSESTEARAPWSQSYPCPL